MKKLLTLLLSLMAVFTLHASEFEYFEMTEQFKDKISKQNQRKLDLAPIIKKVWDKLKEVGIEQVNNLTKEIIDYKQDFSLGELNTPGFSWDLATGNAQVKLGRTLEPAYDSTKWIVVDTIQVSVSARSFLEQLKEDGDIEISDANLKMFSAVRFKRTYTYRHTAETYLKGLATEFDKLLFSFLKFYETRYTELDAGDLVRRDDFLSADLTLSVDTPSVYSLSGYAKGTLYYSKLSSLVYQKPEAEDRSFEEALRVSIRNSKVTGTSVQIGLQADFYKLLKLTLLSGEYRVNISSSHTTNLKFSESDLELIRNDESLQEAMKEVNKGKSPNGSLVLMPFITSHQDSLRIDESLNLQALIWGKHWGNSTEQMTFETRYGKRYFYRHQQERVAMDRSILQFLFANKNLSKFNTRVVENMAFEYEVDSPEAKFEDTTLPLPASATYRISKEFMATKNYKKYRERAKDWIKRFEQIDQGLVSGIEDGELQGPFVLNLHAQVGVNGVNHLIHQDVLDLGDAFEIVCTGEDQPDGVKLGKDETKCIEKLQGQFLVLHNDVVIHNEVNLPAFKNFLETVSNNAVGFSVLKALFGVDNVQIYGSFRAETKDNKPFLTYLKEGFSQGFGLIKDFIKNYL
ncbi:MAG: hypothetical protein EP326_04450 [Deltaproteobacteria bacterium]|nr:MAG: hypothetical protein EP326_04450 [Deltaproteobacteria bacterium]TNF25897.1 MAG: hypothetical protein EP319_15120 [Deltaproteobacteria bacterium]